MANLIIMWLIFLALMSVQVETSHLPSVVDMEIEEVETPSCPCSNPDWCKPIFKQSEKEVFAFTVRSTKSHWDLFPWSKLTTISPFFNDSSEAVKLMCYAHSKGVKIVKPEVPTMQWMLSPDLRKVYIDKVVAAVVDGFLDGVNFDFEARIEKAAEDQREAYTATVGGVYQKLKAINPNYQISIDVSWRPDEYGRYYDYHNLTKVSDFFFIMAYDEPMRHPWLAGPNSGFDFAKMGLDLWENYPGGKIEAKRLVMGVPWYGYVYQCSELIGEDCYRYLDYFEDGTSVDAPQPGYTDYGKAVPFLMDNPEVYRWNASSSTPYYTYQDMNNNNTYQVQYDNPWSVMMKYKLARDRGLLGVGMWQIDCLDYTQTTLGQQIRTDMFNTFDAFLGNL